MIESFNRLPTRVNPVTERDEPNLTKDRMDNAEPKDTASKTESELPSLATLRMEIDDPICTNCRTLAKPPTREYMRIETLLPKLA
jgi:hypothetical protein